MAKFYALYLPQFHPIPENDKWYGKGFTEWRSVASAKPLYPGHYQPHIPSDLGFYDLRLKEILFEQIKLAKDYGIDGFCYWHYWFGNGKELLENPFKMIVNDKSIDFSFAAAWGNATWEKKQWGDKGKNEKLIEQQYLGEEDYIAHFYSLVDAFKDKRYIRIDGKPIFIIYRPTVTEKLIDMIKVWRKLAAKEGLGDIYFIGHDLIGKEREKIFEFGYDAVYDDNMLNIHHQCSPIAKGIWKMLRNIGIPTVFKYEKAIKYMILEDDKKENIFPVIVPNWDHTPRTGSRNIMFRECDPKYFEELTESAVDAIKDKSEEHQIIIVKSWNEWGEGNHMEPDIRYGRGYLEALKRVRERNNV